MCLKGMELVRSGFGFLPDGRQEEVLAGDTRRLLLCCTRQWGKSTTAAALAGMRAVERPGGLIVCVSPTLRQTGELLQKIRTMLEQAGLLVGRGGKLELKLENGSRILGVPGVQANLRGYSAPAVVIVDEAAQVRDDVYRALRPMLAAGGGELVLLSTPFGQRGFFWQEWTHGGAEWRRVAVKASECERIPAAFLAEERRSLGEDWFSQEYECSFLGLQDAAFRAEWLAAAETLGLDVDALGFEFRV